MGFGDLRKIDHRNQIIKLTDITISGYHCNKTTVPGHNKCKLLGPISCSANVTSRSNVLGLKY
jgi:hypothetical protein